MTLGLSPVSATPFPIYHIHKYSFIAVIAYPFALLDMLNLLIEKIITIVNEVVWMVNGT